MEGCADPGLLVKVERAAILSDDASQPEKFNLRIDADALISNGKDSDYDKQGSIFSSGFWQK